MSKYHPLDVRHPNNRDLLSRNYLLDPPRAAPTAPSRAAQSHASPSRSKTAPKPAARVAKTTTGSASSASANPWTSLRTAAGTVGSTLGGTGSTRDTAASKPNRMLRLIVFVVAAVMFLRVGGLSGIADWMNDLRASIPARNPTPDTAPLPPLNLTPAPQGPVSGSATDKP
ncbi:MAG: hypothetical protein R3D60_03875 [Paracoccaceae bacterium]